MGVFFIEFIRQKAIVHREGFDGTLDEAASAAALALDMHEAVVALILDGETGDEIKAVVRTDLA